jgi:hypothetical protein
VYDLAMIPVDPAMLAGTSIVPLDPTDVAPHTRDLDERDVYFAHG